MKVLAIGDVVGEHGCDFLMRRLPKFKRDNAIDFCIVNGENSAKGNGVTPSSAQFILDCGADIITTGNHVFRRSEIYDYFSPQIPFIRPVNFGESAPGCGWYTVDRGSMSITVVNLMGTVYMDNLENPFNAIDRVLDELKGRKNIIVDFHAEATSEKRAMGFYLDGRVSAVFGTHTHIPTADAQILPCGTGYITDIGMTGPIQSVLGITPDLVIKKFRTNMPVRFDNPDGPCKMEGCIFEIDKSTGKAVSAEQITLY